MSGDAKWLNALGVTVFVLKYRHVEYGHPAPLQDILRALRIVRSRAFTPDCRQIPARSRKSAVSRLLAAVAT